MSRATRLRRAAALPVLALAALLGPETALACAVCGGAGSEQTRDAFLATTVFLSVLPPAIVGGIVLWIWRRSRAREGAAATSGRRAAEAAGTSSAAAAS